MDNATGSRLLGGVRVAVGLMLLARPGVARAKDPASRLLVRTIGIRDVVIGSGALISRDPVARTNWIQAGLASDVADFGLAVVSARGLGPGGIIALAAPLPMIAGGIATLRGALSGPGGYPAKRSQAD